VTRCDISVARTHTHRAHLKLGTEVDGTWQGQAFTGLIPRGCTYTSVSAYIIPRCQCHGTQLLKAVSLELPTPSSSASTSLAGFRDDAPARVTSICYGRVRFSHSCHLSCLKQLENTVRPLIIPRTGKIMVPQITNAELFYIIFGYNIGNLVVGNLAD
jgi:hypothetical protein